MPTVRVIWYTHFCGHLFIFADGSIMNLDSFLQRLSQPHNFYVEIKRVNIHDKSINYSEDVIDLCETIHDAAGFQKLWGEI